jgi:hypothetical protein
VTKAKNINKENYTLDIFIGPIKKKNRLLSECKCSPTIRILVIRITSSSFPRCLDNSATARAKAPAVSVPNPRLNPLLKVAPASTLMQINYRIWKNEFAGVHQPLDNSAYVD